MIEKLTFKEKIITFYSYNKYKLPILFALIGLVLLTAFPATHYEYWFEKDSKFNAISVFILMILALVQFVNSINLSNKSNYKSSIVTITIFTSLNILMVFFAYLYISPYFTGFNIKYLKSIIIISSGVLFFLISNVFGFVYLNYDTRKSLRALIDEINEEDN